MSSGIRTTVARAVLLLGVLAATAGCGSDDGDSTATDTGTEASASATVDPSASDSVGGSASADPSMSASPSLPSTTDATEDVAFPECAEIWVVGQQLPPNYQGCTKGGEVVQANGLYCEFGKPLFTYARNFYAVENGPINETATTLGKDKTYQQAVRKCGG